MEPLADLYVYNTTLAEAIDIKNDPRRYARHATVVELSSSFSDESYHPPSWASLPAWDEFVELTREFPGFLVDLCTLLAEFHKAHFAEGATLPAIEKQLRRDGSRLYLLARRPYKGMAPNSVILHGVTLKPMPFHCYLSTLSPDKVKMELLAESRDPQENLLKLERTGFLMLSDENRKNVAAVRGGELLLSREVASEVLQERIRLLEKEADELMDERIRILEKQVEAREKASTPTK